MLVFLFKEGNYSIQDDLLVSLAQKDETFLISKVRETNIAKIVIFGNLTAMVNKVFVYKRMRMNESL